MSRLTMKGTRNPKPDDVRAHLARLRRTLPPAERAAYDERVLAIRTILELTEHRQERRITQRTIAQRMGVSQPVIA